MPGQTTRSSRLKRRRVVVLRDDDLCEAALVDTVGDLLTVARWYQRKHHCVVGHGVFVFYTRTFVLARRGQHGRRSCCRRPRGPSAVFGKKSNILFISSRLEF